MSEPVTYQSFEPPDDNWAKTVCKVGQGAACCRYLAMAPTGWSCMKHTSVADYLDRRMNARSDNCIGRGSR